MGNAVYEMKNSKLETLNPKQTQNPNFKIQDIGFEH